MGMPEREGASSRGRPALPSLCRCRDDALERAAARAVDAEYPDGEARPGEGLPPHDGLGKPQVHAEGAHLLRVRLGVRVRVRVRARVTVRVRVRARVSARAWVSVRAWATVRAWARVGARASGEGRGEGWDSAAVEAAGRAPRPCGSRAGAR